MDAAERRPVLLDPVGNVDASLPWILRWGGLRAWVESNSLENSWAEQEHPRATFAVHQEPGGD
jgi:hypothetical protein